METLNTQLTPFVVRFPALVEELYHNPPGTTTEGNSIENTIRNHFAAMSTANHTWKRETFYRLLTVMYSKRCFGVLRNPAYIDVLANISRFGNKTARPVEEWTKDNLTADGQLASIIRHLFTTYEVPKFMEYVFAESNIIHMHWYIQLGRGDSVMNLCAFPAKFMHKMAHEFRNTPGNAYNIDQAIRRAQALGYGATHNLAEMIAWSANVAEIKDNAFRAKAIQFVAKNARGANFAAIESVIGYVAEKYEAGFNLKGRTWPALVKAAAEHEAEKAKRLAAEARGDWKPLAIADYEITEGENTFSIVQLVSSEELYEEGRSMSHCVAEYEYDCSLADIAIFSLRKFTEGEDGYETLATLEYRADENAIVQAKARFNEDVSLEAEKHILAWAKAEGITIYCELYVAYEEPMPVQAPQAAAAIRLPAEMPRIVPVPRVDPLMAHRRLAEMQAERARNAGADVDPATVIKIILIVLKVLFLLSKAIAVSTPAPVRIQAMPSYRDIPSHSALPVEATGIGTVSESPADYDPTVSHIVSNNLDTLVITKKRGE